MKKLSLLMIMLFVFLSIPIKAQLSAKLIQFPDVSATQIVFLYGGDLWLASKDGGMAYKLTSPKGQEVFPKFSPDGKTIAFNGNYSGSMDIFTIPTEGGVANRVTHHGMSERMLDWYPDGKEILFSSAMESGKQRFNQLYKQPSEGGLPEKLELPYGEIGSISADGSKLAYTPITRAFRNWKRYKGGMAPDIWLYDFKNKSAENITHNIANDEFPMWFKNKIYFLSDRSKENRANIYSYDLATKETKQVTNFKDFDIHYPSIGPSDLVFEAGGKLYLLSLADEKLKEVNITVVTDGITLMPKVVNAASQIQNADISPDGKRALITARGEVFNVPAENGAIINESQSPGSFERYASWSPDGKYAAYWSDASGEYEITIKNLTTNEPAKKVSSYGAGFKYNLYWSPDSKNLCFVDQTMMINVYNIEKDKNTEIEKQRGLFHGGLENFSVSWSSDSRYIAFVRELPNHLNAVALFDTKENKIHQVTSGYYSDTNPTFDPDGKYLYLLTNRNFDPVYSDFEGSWIYPNSTQVAAISLTKEIPSPTAPKNDTTAVKKEEPKKTDDKKDDKKDEKKDDKKKDEIKEVKIDFDGMENRLVLLPVTAGNYNSLNAVSGKVIYSKAPNSGSGEKTSAIKYYDLEKREEKTILADVRGYRLSADGKKLLAMKGNSFTIVDVAPDQKMDKKLPTTQLEFTVTPREEWKQIFNDVWRLERDFFYDKNMHGVDWKAMKTQYGNLIDNCITREDVNFVLGELISELNASHTYKGGGDQEYAESRKTGYLGVDWAVENGAFKIKNIVEAAPWDTEVRSPLAESGVKVKKGDYILEVNGVKLNTKNDPWTNFDNLAGKTIELTVNSKPSLDGSWKVIVTALDDETRLRNLAWIEQNRKRVEEASNGKVGYIYVPSTGTDGQNELVRQFYSQTNKEALIIDERFNNGGQIPDRFIELLNRKPLAFWAVRDGDTWQWPQTAHFGPKVMLINGWSGSGGDAFPDFFKKSQLGPLVGMRTWGGLIGISGAPALIDGGSITVPTFRMYDPDGTWFKEGHGVDPDIEVIDDPAQMVKGIDPQLEAGIKEALRLIKEKPFVYPKHQDYEKR
ncbi:MAG: PDZ domain-containing protein [Melioribacteraceae bacterium]|nr:PDZ domain-containing protein [Melioribacteraceae bacterium]